MKSCLIRLYTKRDREIGWDIPDAPHFHMPGDKHSIDQAGRMHTKAGKAESTEWQEPQSSQKFRCETICRSLPKSNTNGIAGYRLIFLMLAPNKETLPFAKVPPSPTRSYSQRRQLDAFSLIELLVVVAIIGMLAAAAAPALSSILGAKGVVKAVEDTTGIMELARTEAMARRTYVYVAFLNTNSLGSSEILIGAVASLDGSTDTSTNNLRPIAKALKVERAMLTSGLPAQVTSLVSNPAFGMSNNTGLPSFTVGNVNFAGATDGIIFSPNGEALSAATGKTFLPKVDFGLVATRGTTPQTNDGAAVRYHGGSGSIQVFRP